MFRKNSYNSAIDVQGYSLQNYKYVYISIKLWYNPIKEYYAVVKE